MPKSIRYIDGMTAEQVIKKIIEQIEADEEVQDGEVIDNIVEVLNAAGYWKWDPSRKV